MRLSGADAVWCNSPPDPTVRLCVLDKGFPDYPSCSAVRNSVQIANNGGLTENHDGAQHSTVPEGAQRARIRAPVRDRGAMPGRGGRVPMAGRVRLSRMRRATAQGGSER